MYSIGKRYSWPAIAIHDTRVSQVDTFGLSVYLHAQQAARMKQSNIRKFIDSNNWCFDGQ
jgi:ABC-type transporter Mla MlaB component